MRTSRTLVLAVASIALAGCYHVTVTTGSAPATTVIDKPFQHSFVYGLVPPSEMNTKAECPNGVSKVETESSFINGHDLVVDGAVTGGRNWTQHQQGYVALRKAFDQHTG